MPGSPVAQADALAGGADVVSARAGGVEIPQGGVDFQADFLQGFLQRGGVGGVDVRRAGAAGDDVHRRMAQRADLVAGGQRQRAVVFQQHGALAGQLLGDLPVVGFQLLDAGEIALVIDGVVIGAAGVVGGHLQCDVDRLRAGKRQVGTDAGRSEQHGEHAGQHAVQHNAGTFLFGFLFHVSLLLWARFLYPFRRAMVRRRPDALYCKYSVNGPQGGWENRSFRRENRFLGVKKRRPFLAVLHKSGRQFFLFGGRRQGAGRGNTMRSVNTPSCTSEVSCPP